MTRPSHSAVRVREGAVSGRLGRMDRSHARIVVEPVVGGGRRVRVDAEVLGIANSPADLIEFLRRAGLDPDGLRLDDPDLIDWHGGGPDVWA